MDCNKENCKDCIAYQYDEDFGDMCSAVMCIKEQDYDPETRIWTPKKIGKDKKQALLEWIEQNTEDIVVGGINIGIKVIRVEKIKEKIKELF